MGNVDSQNINLADLAKCCGAPSNLQSEPGMEKNLGGSFLPLDDKGNVPGQMRQKKDEREQVNVDEYDDPTLQGPYPPPSQNQEPFVPRGQNDATVKHLSSGKCEIQKRALNDAKVHDIIDKLSAFDWLKQAITHNPKRELRAIHSGPDCDLYEGEWIEDQKDGRGIQKFANGSRYDGFWVQGRNQGYGRLVSVSGDVYVGQFYNDMQHGFGKMQWGDETSYEGEFFQQNLEGIGIYKWADGRVYNGEWSNNIMHGRGVFTWANGNHYKGDFKNDKKDGTGKFTWNDGRVYDGEWSEGKQHGQGEYTHKNGQARKGVWEGGRRLNWMKDDLNMVLLKAVGDQATINKLYKDLMQLLQEDAVVKQIDVDAEKFIDLDDVLSALSTTQEKVDAIAQNSKGGIEIKLMGAKKYIRATTGHKF